MQRGNVVATFDCEVSTDELETLCFQPSGFSVRTTVTYCDPYSQERGRNGLFVAGDPINAFDPDGLATQLALGYTTVIGNEHHTFVVATDTVTGKQIFTRGGPSAGGFSGSGTDSTASSSGGSVSASSGNGGSGGFGLGTIQGKGGAWDGSLPFDKPSNTVVMQPLGISPLSLDEMQARMNEFQSVTNSNNIPYFPTGPNSNSYAFTFVDSLGIPRPTPILPAPGWDMGTPDPSLSYLNKKPCH